MKKASIITVIIGGVLMLIGALPFILTMFFERNVPSVGIIGGADGPTAIFVTSSLWFDFIFGILSFTGFITVVTGIILLIISLCKKNSN